MIGDFFNKVKEISNDVYDGYKKIDPTPQVIEDAIEEVPNILDECNPFKGNE